MNKELKSCPFCGGVALLRHIRGGHRICCDNPDCRVSPEIIEDTPIEATETWNTRASDARIKELEGLLLEAKTELFSICDSCENCDFKSEPDCSTGRLYHKIKSVLKEGN